MSTVAEVRRLYERFPYPHYPLLAKPRWHEGYLAGSSFAQALARDLGFGGTLPKSERGERIEILAAGSGEILPYVLRRWEPDHHRLVCLDLSLKSLNRARFRLIGRRRLCDFVHGSLEDYLATVERRGTRYLHVDAFGVLHHLESPTAALRLLANVLAPGGTMRLMVYNSPARHWIHHLQRAFRLLQLDPYEAEDRRIARRILAELARLSSPMAERMRAMTPTLRCDAGLVDTFFHAREVRWRPSQWIQAIEASGLHVLGLFDRYAELDDLPNPLWNAPSGADLDLRAADGRFEGNLELFLVKPSRRAAAKTPSRVPLVTRLLPPPRLWSSYDETRGLKPGPLRKLWLAHLDHRQGKTRACEAASRLASATLGRLARLGALFPGQLKDPWSALAPLADHMEIPERVTSPTLAGSDVDVIIERILDRRGITGQKRERIRAQALARFGAC